MKDWDEIDWRRVWKQFIFLQADGLVVMEICWKEKIFWADFLVQGLWGIKGLLETQIIGSHKIVLPYDERRHVKLHREKTRLADRVKNM